jgi:hypothetical protein
MKKWFEKLEPGDRIYWADFQRARVQAYVVRMRDGCLLVRHHSTDTIFRHIENPAKVHLFLTELAAWEAIQKHYRHEIDLCNREFRRLLKLQDKASGEIHRIKKDN